VLHSFVLAHAFWSDVSQIVLVQWQQEHTWFHCWLPPESQPGYPCSCVGEICGMFCSFLFCPRVHQGMRLVATLKSMSSLHQHSLLLFFFKTSIALYKKWIREHFGKIITTFLAL
jgi:hypothetical protein